ncbi:hypothetical protein JD844_004438 [Phrynosoma platyrhinos]|uniref:Transmembrane protein 47 n=1 Tax=Phrynosoma platyrhinos TaxID=52577 RepID=A0ABQ7TME3_PHRPL|nr:hypothetical protein JD844_004438 [Phrynosoma platyrhinos]
MPSQEEGSLLRPLKLIALLCASLALALDAAALGSPAWVTSEADSLALWQACSWKQGSAGGGWQCRSALRTVVLQVCALILYPIKFIDSSQLRTYHEFSWGYGLGWGSVIFMLGAAILYCLRIDVYEDAYH